MTIKKEAKLNEWLGGKGTVGTLVMGNRVSYGLCYYGVFET